MEEQYITEDMLRQLDIDLTGQDTIALLAHLNDTLEERIGVEITESLDDKQLQELLDLQESGRDDEITTWLEANVPELPEIVSDHVDALLGELVDSTDEPDPAA